MNTTVRWVLAVAAILVVGVLWVVCGDTDPDDTVPSVVEPPAAEPQESLTKPQESLTEPRDSPPEVPPFDPFTTPTLSDIDLPRLAEAVDTLVFGVPCPVHLPVGSLEDVAEVVRITGGCLMVEYVPLDGRTIDEVRRVLSSDPEVHAVGVPVLEVWPAQAGTESSDPESGRQWHLTRLQAGRLWQGWPDGAEVTVAVIDSGVDAEHRDLSHSVVGGSLEDHQCHTSDQNGHGTRRGGNHLS